MTESIDITISSSIDVTVECNVCGSDLSASISYSDHSESMDVSIDPCQGCLEDAHTEGAESVETEQKEYQDGREEGYNEGYAEGEDFGYKKGVEDGQNNE